MTTLLYQLPVEIQKSRSVVRKAADSILDENPQRWVSLPIQFHKIWEAYKAHETHFWTAEDVDVADIIKECDRLPKDLADAFFELMAQDACALFGNEDCENFKGIGLFKLDKCAASSALTNDVQIPEARAFYGFQSSYENILLELQSTALLCACNEEMEKYHALVDDAARDPIGVKRALFWQRHVWDKNEVGIEEECPSIQERVVADGLLKAVQVFGHRILRDVINHRYPSLKGSAIYRVLQHCIETAQRHTAFAVMLHKSFTEPLDEASTLAMRDLFLDTEIEFLEKRVFKQFFSFNIVRYRTELIQNESQCLKSTFGFGSSPTELNTTIGDGTVVSHPTIQVEGDSVVEFEDDHAQYHTDTLSASACPTGMSEKATDVTKDYPAFSLQHDSDF